MKRHFAPFLLNKQYYVYSRQKRKKKNYKKKKIEQNQTTKSTENSCSQVNSIDRLTMIFIEIHTTMEKRRSKEEKWERPNKLVEFFSSLVAFEGWMLKEWTCYAHSHSWTKLKHIKMIAYFYSVLYVVYCVATTMVNIFIAVDSPKRNENTLLCLRFNYTHKLSLRNYID